MKDQDFDDLVAKYEQLQRQQPIPKFDRQIVSHAAKLLNAGVPARQALDACIKFDANRGKASIGKASVAHSFRWLLQKKLAERNGGGGDERP
jgi:hypothetical protein